MTGIGMHPHEERQKVYNSIVSLIVNYKGVLNQTSDADIVAAYRHTALAIEEVSYKREDLIVFGENG